MCLEIVNIKWLYYKHPTLSLNNIKNIMLEKITLITFLSTSFCHSVMEKFKHVERRMDTRSPCYSASKNINT